MLDAYLWVLDIYYLPRLDYESVTYDMSLFTYISCLLLFELVVGFVLRLC